MRFWLLCLIVVFAGCTSTGAAEPTPRGPVVPTRVIPTNTPTWTPTATLTLSPTDTPSLTPTTTDTPESTATPSETATDLPTETPEPTATDTPIPTDTDTPEPTATDTPEPTATDTPIPTDTPEPTATDTPIPTDTPEPTATDTPIPTNTPLPTDTPTPTETPSLAVTAPPDPDTLYTLATALDPAYIYAQVGIGDDITGSLDDETPTVLYRFDGTAGTQIDIFMDGISGDLDPYLIVLDPKGGELVRNDDAEVGSSRNAAITGLILPETGAYVIVATRYEQLFGESTGEYNLRIGDGTASMITGQYAQLTSYEALLIDALDPNDSERLYTFRGMAGDVVSIRMSYTTGNLDPRLTLMDNLGNTLAINDDDLFTGTFNAAILRYVLPRTGYYTISAGRYSGDDNAGDYQIKLTRDGQSTSGIYAMLDPVNSRTIDDELLYYINFSAGDTINNNGQESALQSLLTFRLPPLAEGRRVSGAALQFEPCYPRGGGFDELGTLTVYAERYGRLNEARNISRPIPGARVIGTLTSCAPLDIQQEVADAYASGLNTVQFRVVFRDRTDNSIEDEILFTPSLLVSFE